MKLKAKIENPKKIKEKIKKFASFIGKSKFVDYFFKSDKPSQVSELRLRKLDHKKIITLKILLRRNRIQENIGYKFSVDRADDFVEFLEYIGFKPSCLLRKNSEIYTYRNVVIALTELKDLGYYLELKIDSYGKDFEKNKKKLFSIAKRLGLKKQEIDSRYYSRIKEERDRELG